jgi:DNA-binding XRE family transcriptional regulator
MENTMTNEGFKTWRMMMDLTQARAAEMLGLSKPTIENYERGTRRDTGEPVAIPPHVALACAALYHKIAPWEDGDHRAGVFG